MITISNLSRVIVCFGVLGIASCKKANAKIPVVSLQDIPGVAISIAAVCDSASDTNGKLRIDGTLDTVTARGFPAVHPACTLVFRFIFTPVEYRKHDFKVRLIDPDGASFGGEIEGKIDATTSKIENPIFSKNVLINLHNLQLAKPGVYCIQMWVDGKLLDQTHFIAKQV
jgi:hypothetical protein